MARILIYDTTTRKIHTALPTAVSDGTWDNSATYSADGKITMDGYDRVRGLGSGMSVLKFTGTIPAEFDDTFGSNPTQGLIYELNAGLDTIQVIT